jgi:hypothetical protein
LSSREAFTLVHPGAGQDLTVAPTGTAARLESDEQKCYTRERLREEVRKIEIPGRQASGDVSWQCMAGE